MAVGTITKEAIDTLAIESGGRGYYPDAIWVAGEVYACVYNGPGEDGWLQTFSCSVTGSLSDAVLASFEFDGTHGDLATINRISGTNVFIITYTTTNNNGVIYTLSISDDGLTITYIDTWAFTSDNSALGGTVLTHVSGTIYAIAYTRNASIVYRIATLSIADNGIITKSLISSLGVGVGSRPRTLIKHTGNVFIYSASGTVYTLLINDAGTSITTINSAVTESNGASDAHLLHLNGSANPAYYAMFSRETASPFDGNISTFSITAGGVLTGSNIDTRKVSNDMTTNYPLNLSGGVRTWCETGPGNDGYVHTRSISDVGIINATDVDSWEFDTTIGQYFKMLNVSGNIFMIIYKDSAGVKALTLDIYNSTSIFPTDPTVRVSSIIHRYDRFKGVYQLELSLGDVTSKFGLPYELDARRGTGTEQQAEEAAPIVDEAVAAVKSQDAMARLLEVAKAQAAERAALLQNILFSASAKVTAPQPPPPTINPMKPTSVEQEARMTAGWKRIETALARQAALLKSRDKET